MTLTDYLTIGGIFSAIIAVSGWWLKSRLENSIKYEYDRLLEAYKTEQKRSEVFYAERLSAFKDLSAKLTALRKYCRARSAEIRDQSEFEPRTESLSESENKSLLCHNEEISKCLDEKELFISVPSRVKFNEFFQQISLGFNLELWLSGGASPDDLNAHELYDLVEERINAILESLYCDLGFPNDQA